MGDDVDVLIAGIAHRLWMRRLTALGWKYGPKYCPEARTHDALVPFEQLARTDRRAALVAAMTSGARSALEGAVEYARGPDRPFSVEEVSAGLPVCEPGRAQRRGRVESWSTDEDGELAVIRVRWDDGEVTEHAATERELARPEP